jgi:S1-C subfamily serine protease
MIETTPTGHGLVVKTVAPASNAERAGLQQGDLLQALDGEELTDPFDLVYAVKQKQPDSHGTLQVRRQDKTLTVDILFRETGDGHPQGKP